MVSPWQYSTIHKSSCKVVEEQTLWGQSLCRIWLPNQDAVVRVPRSALRPLSSDLQPEVEAKRIAYVAAAAKVAEVLEGSTSATAGHVLLAPMESNVIPLPHQIHALSRAISGDRVRYLLADEVGLGKTIEAGLVMRELKLRGLVRRILVVSPNGIATQWVAEMQTHFSEQFQLVLGDDISTLQRLAPGADQRNSAWSMFNQVIVSLDSVKPMDKRRGWTAERVADYNRSRFEDLITAGWDLVVVDEAHRLGGSTDQVARYKLGKGLAEAAPYVLLLSATPHQGKTDAFHRLMNLLDDEAFPDMDSVSRERVAPYVIRTEKRKAIDADGKPLFKRSRKPGSWEDPVAMYRRLLAAEPDNSVVVVSVGFSGNLAALLASGGDDVSPLTGRELVARKVKYFSVMAGSFGVKKRAEYNVINDIPAARKFFAECPSPIVLTPFEIGKQVVYPGRSIAEDFGWAEHHPMVEAYKAYHEMPYDRPTWDVIATYYVLPHEPSSLTLSIPGRRLLDEQGFIFFTPDKAGQHRYITASDRQAGMILGYFLRALPERPLRYMR